MGTAAFRVVIFITITCEIIQVCYDIKAISGEVAEWSIALDLKSSVPRGTVGSNPTLSVL